MERYSRSWIDDHFGTEALSIRPYGCAVIDFRATDLVVYFQWALVRRFKIE